MTSNPLVTRSFAVADLLVRADQRTVCGIAVPFGIEALVSDDGYSQYRESFAPGAFRRTIVDGGTGKVKLLRQHDGGTLAVGKASLLREDPQGLWAELAVSKIPAGDELLELVRDGVCDSFSVGFQPIADRQVGGVIVRTEVRLREISAVNFPAYAGAQIAGLRSAPTLSADALSDLAARRLAVARARSLLLSDPFGDSHA
jgi:HK97 family phage prohead protease